MAFPLINSAASQLPSPSSSSAAANAAPSFVLDRDAVLRRASSIRNCRAVPVVTAAASAAPSPQPPPSSPSMIFPGVSVRRAAFQNSSNRNKAAASGGSSGSSSSNHGASSTSRYSNDTSSSGSVVSFLVGGGGADDDGDKEGAAPDSLPARVTVFLDTGTVCTSRVSLWDSGSQIRHVFRRNVTTLDAVERLLKYPPSITPIDHTLVGLDDDTDESDDDVDENENDPATTVKDPLQVLKSELDLAQVGVAVLQEEKSKLEHHLQSLVEEEGKRQQYRPAFAASHPTAAAAAAAAIGASTAPLPYGSPSAVAAAAKTPAGADSGDSAKPKPPPPQPQHALGWSPKPQPHPQPRLPGASARPAAAQPPAAVAVASPASSVISSNSINSNAVIKDIGMEFQFSLSASSMKHVDQCMSDITGMNKLIRGVATSGRGTVFLYGNGGVAYTPNIPRQLHHKLSQLRSNAKMSSRPSYVSLGSKDRFYCAFHDGTYCLKGPKSLEKELKRCFAASLSSSTTTTTSALPSMLHHHNAQQSQSQTQPQQLMPVSVAFGSTWEAWFVVFADGSWKFQGKIPKDLSDKLKSRKDKGDLVRVTLGPSGEWFVKAKNGRMWWGGLTDAADSSIQLLLKDHVLCFLDFGEDGSYFVSYD